MKKAKLIRKIMVGLNESLDVLQKAARAAHAEATHESSKAENKYDTRGLEAAYLAGGQARQAKEIMDSIASYEKLVARDFAADEPIDLTAVVEVEANRDRQVYFIGPTGGGLEVQFEGKEVTVITPKSPLGQNLMGKKASQKWTTQVGGAVTKYCIISVG